MAAERPAVASGPDRADGELFSFTLFPRSQWKSIPILNATDRLREECLRRVETQAMLPSAESVVMLL
ncbi:MAG: transposase [Methylocella sp.]